MAYNKRLHLQDNILAIRTAFGLEKMNSKPTAEQIQYLKAYTGFGGLKCILNPCENPEDVDKWVKTERHLFPLTVALYDLIKQSARDENEYKQLCGSLRRSVLTSFYTPKPVTDAIAAALATSGIPMQNVLDPSAGIGIFAESFSRYTDDPVTCIEKDLITGKILRCLQPGNNVYIQGFEDLQIDNDAGYDIITSNIPFGDYRIYDPAFLKDKDKAKQQCCKNIHGYFFVKAVDLLKEGGILAFITSQGLMNSPANRSTREWLMKQCNLVSAIRLPNNLFTETANTEVGSDLIVLQKNTGKTECKPHEKAFTATRIINDECTINNYFFNFENIIYTTARRSTDQYGKPYPEFIFEDTIDQLAKTLQQKLSADCKTHLDMNLCNTEEDPGPDISLYDLFGIPVEERTQIKQRQKTHTKEPEPIAITIPESDINTEEYTDNQNYTCQTAPEALAASLNKYGKIDINYMSKISSMNEEEIINQLKNQIYFNPLSHQYEVAAKFISSDVISKADVIENYIKDHPSSTNIEESKHSLAALRQATPEPIPFTDLDFNFGERWIPANYFAQYATQLFNTTVTIDYFIDIDNFNIAAKNERTVEIREKHAVKPDYSNVVDGLKLLSYALINTHPKITKPSGRYDINGNEIRIPDLEAIQQANSKIEEVRTGFTAWLNDQPTEIKENLAEMYNRKFNCRVIPKYDGRFQTFPGLHLKELNIPYLYDNQYNSVWQALLNEGVIVDNSVGTGKSLIMCLIAHEMKRQKLIRKPLLVCLKTNVTAIAEHFCKAYPNDQILFPTEGDFEPGNRKRLFHKMQTGNWDAIIITHEQFFKLPQSLEIQRDILQKELDSIRENLRVWEKLNNKNATAGMYKGLLKREENLEARLKWVFSKMQARRDAVVDFKTMEIDHILIDESQEFKNLQFDTRYRNVAGLGDPYGSQRALNLLYAIRTIQYEKKKDLCATFLTATTISNSLVELYLIFKYLRPKALEGQGIRTFDAWAAVYAKKSSDFEFTVTNEIKARERFRFFKNVPELATFYNEITNYTTAKDIKIDKPESNIRLFTTKATPEQNEFQEKLIEFAKTGKGELIGRPGANYDSSQSGRMLIVTDLARKAAVDMRLIDPDKYHDHPDNKLSQAATNIAELYYKYNEQKGTQMVFLDIGTYKPDKWNAYSELKRKLIEDHHIPHHEIRFIQEAKNLNQRDQIKNAFRQGIIRILIGHTKSLGTAMDCPDKGVCSHSINMPWTPKDLEQRDGRLARKGNLVAKNYLDNTVDHILYASENSLDTYMFNLLQTKQNFIVQLKTNSLGNRTLDEGAMDSDGNISYSEYVAILSGNSDLLDRVKLDRKISVLESEFKAHKKQLSKTEFSLSFAEGDLRNATERLEGLKKDMEKVNASLPKDENGIRPNPIQLDGFDHNNDLEAISERLIWLDKNRYTGGRYDKIGSILDFNILIVSNQSLELTNRFFIEGALKYSYNAGLIAHDPLLAATNFIKALDKIPNLIIKYEEDILTHTNEIKVMKEILNTPWRKEDELKRLKLELDTLDRKIQHALTEIGNPENVTGTPEVVEILEEVEVVEVE